MLPSDRSTDAGRRDRETYAIIGAAMEVHGILGSGFLEAVYCEAMSVELAARGVPYRRSVSLPVVYKENELPVHYRPDFVCFESVVVELKALKQVTRLELAQLVNYLKASRIRRGLLLNFGGGRLDYRRAVL